jgi:hypothetical protein
MQGKLNDYISGGRKDWVRHDRHEFTIIASNPRAPGLRLVKTGCHEFTIIASNPRAPGLRLVKRRPQL